MALHGAGIGLGLAARKVGVRLTDTGLRIGGGAVALAGVALATI